MSQICSGVSSSDANECEGEGEGEGNKGDTTLDECEGKFVDEKRDSSCSGECFGRCEMLFQAEGRSKRGTCGVNNVM